MNPGKILFAAMVTLLVPLDSQSGLPRGLTETEKLLLNLIGSSRTITDPPDSIVFAPAEFDSVAGILFAWEGYTTLLKQLIRETAESDTAWVVVNDAAEAASVGGQLQTYGADMTRVVFIQNVLNSVWMRDYGPWWIYQPDGSRAIIDLDYNRPRPADDQFPEVLANQWNLDYYGTGLVEAGGNMLLDGRGAVMVSDVIFDASQGFDPNLTPELLSQYMLTYLGVHKVIITDHLQYDGTGHIDMFVKVLNDTLVVVGEYETPSAGAGNNYNICNQVAEQLAAETNGAGQPYQVVRMLMPPYDGNTYTYINSLIVNKKVYVPVYGFATDSTVLAQYQSILPGYEILGFDCNQIIPANGAIHCIAMKVPALPEYVDPCQDWTPGDTNNDGVTDIYDILIVADVITGYGDHGPCALATADVNEDGANTVMDIIVLLNQVMGW